MKDAILSPCALCDADEARSWYEAREPGLGRDFLEMLEEGLMRISANPELYRPVRGPYRKCLMRRFPFLIVYEIRPTNLWILAVFHTARDPSILLKRLRNPGAG